MRAPLRVRQQARLFGVWPVREPRSDLKRGSGDECRYGRVCEAKALVFQFDDLRLQFDRHEKSGVLHHNKTAKKIRRRHRNLSDYITEAWAASTCTDKTTCARTGFGFCARTDFSCGHLSLAFEPECRSRD